MILGVGHLGILVADIERTINAVCEAFSLPLPQVRDVPERGMKVAVLDLFGLGLEFIEDYGKEGPFAATLGDRDAVIHHVALKTDDITADMADFLARGLQTLTPTAKTGLRGKRIAFLDPQGTAGIPIELTEP